MTEVKSARHFCSIEDLIEFVERDVVADEIRSLFRLDGIEYQWVNDGTLIPSISASFSSPYLYRGQTRRYQPCVPSVFRGMGYAPNPQRLSPTDKAKCFVSRVRLEEFCMVLAGHPAAEYAREIGLRMYPHALAQHYELETDRIDLTQDHMVAAFFATNSRFEGNWSPVSDGVGVFYRIHHVSFLRHFQSRLECIGKQALPRPGEQKAHVLSLPFGLDFESLPVETYTFSQVESCGQRLNDYFEGGLSLFPSDVMSEIAVAINCEATVPLAVVDNLLNSDRAVLSMLDCTADEAVKLVERHSPVRIAGRELVRMTSSQLVKAQASVQEMRSTFLNNVGALAVRNI